MQASSNDDEEDGCAFAKHFMPDLITGTKFKLKPPPKDVPPFAGDSSTLRLTQVPTGQEPRNYYLAHPQNRLPPVISSSDFVPPALIEHLMRRKKNSAIGVKFVLRPYSTPGKSPPPDKVTNMEGALHTFVTPITLSMMHGDYYRGPGHAIRKFKAIDGSQQARIVIVSASVQPDFENHEVMLELCQLSHDAITGSTLPANFKIPLVETKQESSARVSYDLSLKKHMIHHLTSTQALPALHTVTPISMSAAITVLEHHIEQGSLPNFKDLYVHIKRRPISEQRVISLEILFNTAIHQFRNEFSALGHIAPQGYVYTFDPAAIFARLLDGDATLLNRIYIVALARLAVDNASFPNMRVFAFNDYVDGTALQYVEKALAPHPNVEAVSKSSLFNDGQFPSETLGYRPVKGTEGALLVLHNNSDAFGQNIETEGAGGSMDGAIGGATSAASSLMRGRGDLMRWCM